MLPATWTLALALVLQSPPQPVQRDARSDHPITHFFQNIVLDAVALPSLTTAKTLVVGSSAAALAHLADPDVANWAARQPHSRYTVVGDKIGLGAIQGGAALATYGIGLMTHQRKVAHVGGDLIRAQALSAVIVQGMKISLDRTRPSGGRYSFPSGHTADAFTSAAVLAGHFGWKVAVPAYATASFVGWTRIRDRQHYPSDIAFGATVGIMVGTTITRGHKQSEWSVVPVRTAGGFAVYVVKR